MTCPAKRDLPPQSACVRTVLRGPVDCSGIHSPCRELSVSESPGPCGAGWTRPEVGSCDIWEAAGSSTRCAVRTSLVRGGDTVAEASAGSSWSSLSSPPAPALQALVTNSNPRPATVVFSAAHRGSGHRETTASEGDATGSPLSASGLAR